MLFLVLEFSLQALHFNLQLDVLKTTKPLTMRGCPKPPIQDSSLSFTLHLGESSQRPSGENVGSPRQQPKEGWKYCQPQNSPELLIHPANSIFTTLDGETCPHLFALRGTEQHSAYYKFFLKVWVFFLKPNAGSAHRIIFLMYQRMSLFKEIT